MKDVLFVGTGGVGAELTADDAIATVAFYPGGDAAHYQFGPDFALELFRTISAHFMANGGRLQLIRYRGELAPIAIGDLAPFGVPVMPAP